MNYYSFHIGDWSLHTSHLTIEEEGVYRRLLDFYYDTESPIPEITQPVIRRLRLGSYAETVALILAEFFVLEADGWHNHRADLEIIAYRNKAAKAQENGKKGGRPPKNSGLETKPVNSANPEITGSKANQEPRTNNQEPITKESKDQSGAKAPSQKKTNPALGPAFLIDQGATEQHAADWLKARKSPLTQTAWDAVVREAAKAGITPAAAIQVCAENTWRGFRADWYANSGAGNGSQNQASQRVDNSAVGQVKRAIAEREAADREAGATTHGQAGAENVRDIRPPLDGEFRRVV